MKKQKILLAIAILLAGLLSNPIKAHAESFTLNAGWDDPTCTGTINGSTGIHYFDMIAGNSLTLTVVNQSSLLLEITYTQPGGIGFYRDVSPGHSDIETFNSVSGGSNVSVSEDPNTSACNNAGSSGPGPASAVINADLKPASSGGGSSTGSGTSSPTTTTPKSSSTQTPTSSSPSVPTTTQPPTNLQSEVQVTSVNIGGKKVLASDIHLNNGQSMTISGHTAPNDIVTLVIHSTPRTATVTADGSGNWSYLVSGLETGSHYIEATVKDPKTNQSTSSSKILSFTVNPPVAKTVASKPKAKLAYYIAAVVFVSVLAAAAYWLKRKQPIESTTDYQMPTTDHSAPVVIHSETSLPTYDDGNDTQLN